MELVLPSFHIFGQKYSVFSIFNKIGPFLKNKYKILVENFNLGYFGTSSYKIRHV